MFNALRIKKLYSFLLLSSLFCSPAVFADNMMPVEIINNTGIADPSQVYVVIKGTNPGQNSDCFMKVDSTGVAACVTATAGQRSDSFAFTLSSLPKGDDENGYKLSLPMVDSGRMMFSLNYPTSVTAVVNDLGNVKIGDPDGFDPKDLNYYTLYDKVEFSYNTSGVWINPTAVDFFGLPIRIENDNSALSASGYLSKRTDIFKSFQNTLNAYDKTPTKIWNNLFVNYKNEDGTNTQLRFVSPGKALGNTPRNFNKDYLHNSGAQQFDYIGFLQQYYTTNALTIDCSELKGLYPTDNFIYSGKMDAQGNFVFKNQTGSDTVTIPNKAINTFLFFAGSSDDPTFAAQSVNNTPAAVIVKFLTSAFDVGLLPTLTPDAVLSKDYFPNMKDHYYTVNPQLPKTGQNSGPWYDLYAKAIHTAGGANQPIYAFAYDDALGQDGTLHDPNASRPALTKITLGDLTGTVIPDPYADNTTYSVNFGIPFDSNKQPYQINMMSKDGTTTTVKPGESYTVTMPLRLDLVYYNNTDLTIYLKNGIVKPAFPGIVITKDPNDATNVTINFPAP